MPKRSKKTPPASSWSYSKCVHCFVVYCFQKLYLCGGKQHNCTIDLIIECCVLLSKIVSLRRKTAAQRFKLQPLGCVLLSKIISLRRKTVGRCRGLHALPLCIAFKNYIFAEKNSPPLYLSLHIPVVYCFQKLYLCGEKQLAIAYSCLPRSCVLLSKIISLRRKTVMLPYDIDACMLCIAFKNYIFAEKKQSRGVFQLWYYCCVLLSKIISLRRKNSRTAILYNAHWLCIAFKNYIFAEKKQYAENFIASLFSCVLLSKIISLRRKNSTVRLLVATTLVVYCFQKLYLCGEKTVSHLNTIEKDMLCIAFKNYIFAEKKQ